MRCCLPEVVRAAVAAANSQALAGVCVAVDASAAGIIACRRRSGKWRHTSVSWTVKPLMLKARQAWREKQKERKCACFVGVGFGGVVGVGVCVWARMLGGILSVDVARELDLTWCGRCGCAFLCLSLHRPRASSTTPHPADTETTTAAATPEPQSGMTMHPLPPRHSVPASPSTTASPPGSPTRLGLEGAGRGLTLPPSPLVRGRGSPSTQSLGGFSVDNDAALTFDADGAEHGSSLPLTEPGTQRAATANTTTRRRRRRGARRNGGKRRARRSRVRSASRGTRGSVSSSQAYDASVDDGAQPSSPALTEPHGSATTAAAPHNDAPALLEGKYSGGVVGETKLGEQEWETEIARNILRLYRADVHAQAAQQALTEAAAADQAAQHALGGGGGGGGGGGSEHRAVDGHQRSSPNPSRPGTSQVPVTAPVYEPRRRRASLPQITATSLDQPSTATNVLKRPGKPQDPTHTFVARPLKRVLRLVPRPPRDDEGVLLLVAFVVFVRCCCRRRVSFVWREGGREGALALVSRPCVLPSIVIRASHGVCCCVALSLAQTWIPVLPRP